MAARTEAQREARKAKRAAAKLAAMDARGDVPETDAQLEAILDATPEVKPAKAAKPQVECGCGCGVLVNRRFLPGHDGRLKGDLIRRIKAARTLGSHELEDEAVARMSDLGWTKFIPPVA